MSVSSVASHAQVEASTHASSSVDALDAGCDVSSASAGSLSSGSGVEQVPVDTHALAYYAGVLVSLIVGGLLITTVVLCLRRRERAPYARLHTNTPRADVGDVSLTAIGRTDFDASESDSNSFLPPPSPPADLPLGGSGVDDAVFDLADQSDNQLHASASDLADQPDNQLHAGESDFSDFSGDDEDFPADGGLSS